MPASTRTKTARNATTSPSKRSEKITSESKRGKGRPPLLQLDDETVRKIENLARIQCTEEEAAAVLAVSQPTLNRFLNNNEKAMEAWQNGAKSGRASVRRWQFKSAEGGNVTMQIWLGKQLLDQKDATSRVEVGKPGEFAELEDMSDAELADIARGSGVGTPAKENGAARPARLH